MTLPTLPKVACEFRIRDQSGQTKAVFEQRPYAPPIFFLAPGRCFSSLACAILGQHPQLYGLPETQLLVRDTMREWWESFGETIHSNGLSRAVAEIVFGAQSASAVRRARKWLWRRRNLPTNVVLSKLAALVFPLRIVEKTPMVTYRAEHMRRTFQHFPNARFIHLVRNPIDSGLSLIGFYHARGPSRDPQRLRERLRNPESIFFRMYDDTTDPPVLDPAEAWFVRQSEVLRFLAGVPVEQQMRVRGEDLVSDPGSVLRPLCDWLGIRSDEVAIKEMKSPERGPYACFGPRNARHGADPKFLADPCFRPREMEHCQLDGPVPWSSHGHELKPHVKELARSFGYV